MAISSSTLKNLFQNNWLVSEGGSYPESATQSGQRFAQAVSQWFSAAQANGIPCATAMVRQGQLAVQAASAMQVGVAPGAGAQLALAVAAYYAGQNFGPGVATFPAAAGAGVSMISAVFADLEMSNGDRAEAIATACYAMAVSTIVTFSIPPYAATIL